MNSRLQKRGAQLAIVILAIFLFLGAGDDARFNKIGHSMMCTCGCSQVLLECNHVGCQSSDKMRNELIAALTGLVMVAPVLSIQPARPASISD